jgi:WhiB family redox-sensing transcriptional regulator
MEDQNSYARTWRRDSACRDDRLAERNVSPDVFFPYVETLGVLMDIRKRFCNLCPVTGECLDTALKLNATGIWGGLSTAERRAMNRRRTRAKCPVCAAAEPVTVDGAQVCASCGSSWEPDRPSRAKKAA